MKRVLLLLVVVAGAIAAAAFTVSSNAATIDNTQISQGTLADDLNAIAHSPQYQCYLNAEVGLSTQGEVTNLPIAGAGQDPKNTDLGSFSGAFVRFWLNQMIHQAAVGAYAANHGLSPSPALLRTAREEISAGVDGTFSEASSDGLSVGCTSSGPAVLASVPTSFVNELVNDQANNDLVNAHSIGAGLTPADVKAYFDSHSSNFDTLCVHDVGASTQAAATTMRNQLLLGIPLATVAKSSVVSSTVPEQGDGCIAPTDQLYPLVAEQTKGLAPGGVSKPFANGSDYFLFQLDSRTPVPFSKLPALLVEESIINVGEQRASTNVDRFLSNASITVDPSDGTWTKLSPTEGVFALPSPATSLLLSTTADNPPAISTAAPAAPSPEG